MSVRAEQPLVALVRQLMADCNTGQLMLLLAGDVKILAMMLLSEVGCPFEGSVTVKHCCNMLKLVCELGHTAEQGPAPLSVELNWLTTAAH